MLFILVALVISFFLFLSTCRLHEKSVNMEKIHYEQQSIFYSINESEVKNTREKLKGMQELYENNYNKYILKIKKLELSLQERVNEYKIDSSYMNDEIMKEINQIDIKSLQSIIMESRHD